MYPTEIESPLPAGRRDLAVARVTQRQQVVPPVAATVAPRPDVMHVCCWLDAPSLLAVSAERMGSKVGSTRTLPSTTVAALGSRAALRVMLGRRCPAQWPAHAAHASLHQPGASRPPTRRRRPGWHGGIPLAHQRRSLSLHDHEMESPLVSFAGVSCV